MSNFLQSAAILSYEPGKVLLGYGPFLSTKKRIAGRLGIYAPDFFLDDPKPWKHPTDHVELDITELQTKLEALPKLAPEIVWSAPQIHDFHALFAELKEIIQGGRLTKGVPVIFEQGCLESSTEKLLPWLLQFVLSAPNSMRPYGIWDESEGMLGASPEILFELSSESILKTMAIAGTADVESGDALLLDEKEKHEHQLVVDDLVEVLSSLGSVSCDETKVIQAEQLEHLYTALQVELSGKQSFESLVKSLHPTPALGVAPRGNGDGWLRKMNKQVPRGFFGAPFGVEWPDGRAVCFVAIRNMQWNSNKVMLGSGCGVVKSSECKKEWQELALKRASVKRMLGI